MLGQTWAQSHLSAPRAAILMTMEPVFAALFAILFGGESLGIRILVGGFFVLSAMLIAELTATKEPATIDGRVRLSHPARPGHQDYQGR